MRHVVKRRFGADWENLPWRGDMGEILFPSRGSVLGMVIVSAWIVAAVLGFINAGFVGFWLGIASIVPVSIAWRIIAYAIARLAIEYWNDLN